MNFNVQIKGLDTFEAAMAKAPDIARPILQQAINISVDILAKYTVPPTVPYRTGQLVQTFKRDVQDFMARWFPTVKYAPFVEYGSKPHVILPKNKKALYWPGAAHPVSRINHPGSRANPYMERILANAQSDIDHTFMEATELLLQKLATQ